MTWTNAFDVGECTVKVMSNDTYAFSGVLGKGESSGEFTDETNGNVLSVDVSSDGVVALSIVSGNVDGSWQRVDVIPSYDISATSIRARGIIMPGDDGDNGFAESSDANTGSITLSTSDGGATYTPDPVDLSALTPRDGILVGLDRPS